MKSCTGKANRKPFRAETVRGEPYFVGERKLTPVARIVSFGKARATVGTGQVGGWGLGYTRVTPAAVLEETADGERYIAVTDSTAAALRAMLGGALVTTLFFTILRWVANRPSRG